jgi:hypothetical protein
VEWLLYIATGKAVDGPHTAARPGEWLGLGLLLDDTPHWPRSIVAKDRLEGWRLSLTDLAALHAPGPRSAFLKRIQALPWVANHTKETTNGEPVGPRSRSSTPT